MSESSDIPIVCPGSSTAEAAKSGPENRRQLRYPFSAAAEIREIRSETRISGRCSDLGAGGCYIDTLSPFAAGAFVKIQMKRDAHEFEATAVVAYAHVSMGMGLTFTEMKREHWDVLRSWLAELSGERPPDAASPAPPAETPTPSSEPSDANASIRLVLNELLYLLVRKKIITENEASGLLRQMFR